MQLFILLKIYFLYLPYMFRALSETTTTNQSTGTCRATSTGEPPRQTSPQAHAEPLVQENHHGTSTVKAPRQTSPQAQAEPLVQENNHGTSTVKPQRQTSPQAHADEQHKHHMNQMVVYKKQLEIPLIMGL